MKPEGIKVKNMIRKETSRGLEVWLIGMHELNNPKLNGKRIIVDIHALNTINPQQYADLKNITEAKKMVVIASEQTTIQCALLARMFPSVITLPIFVATLEKALAYFDYAEVN